MDPALQTALEAPAFKMFTAVEITLPSAEVIRVLDGAAELTLFGHLFTGKDATYGALSSIDQIADGDDGQAPAVRVIFEVPSVAALATLVAAEVQGSPVSIWAGAVNLTTGLAVGTEPMFLGEIDVPTPNIGPQSRSVENDCKSVFERFFDRDGGERLSHAFWTSVWPGDLGLEFMVNITRRVLWGANVIGAPGASYGGGGIGGGGTVHPPIP